MSNISIFLITFVIKPDVPSIDSTVKKRCTYVWLWWFMSVKSSVLWLNPKCEFWTKDEIDYLAPSCSQHEIHCTIHTAKCLLIWSWWFSAKGNLYPIKTVTFSTFKATRPQYACMIFIIIFSTLVHGTEFLAKYEIYMKILNFLTFESMYEFSKFWIFMKLFIHKHS